MTLRGVLGPLAAVAAAGVVAHFLALAAVPSLIMGEIIRRTRADYGTNVLGFAEQPAVDRQTIVRSSPDFIYSICAFDLTDGPVRVTTPKIRGTYTSLALYAANTDNFYVENDRHTTAPAISVVIARQGARPVTDIPVAISPSMHGLALVRVLVGSDPALARAADTRRREGRCEPLA